MTELCARFLSLAFVLLSACTGPTDPEADADSALNLQDAQAAAVVAAAGRKP